MQFDQLGDFIYDLLYRSYDINGCFTNSDDTLVADLCHPSVSVLVLFYEATTKTNDVFGAFRINAAWKCYGR